MSLITITVVAVLLLVGSGIILSALTLYKLGKIDQRTINLPTMDENIIRIGEALNVLIEDANASMMMMDSGGMMPQGETGKMVLRSNDGKYVADNIDDLIEQMAAGGDLHVPPEEIIRLKTMFINAKETLDLIQLSEIDVEIEGDEQGYREDEDDDDDSE